MARIIRLSERDLEEELRQFERQFGMDSKDFFRAWQDGEFRDADREEYLDWASLCYMARRSPGVAVPA